MYEWKQRFSKSSFTSCKPILDGIQAIEECGIVLEPSPQFATISPREGSREQTSTEVNRNGALNTLDESPFDDASAETHLNMRSGFDLKILYRHVSQLLASFDEQGDAIFLDPSSRNLLLLCSYSQPELRHMIESEVLLGTNEKVGFPPIVTSSSSIGSFY